MSHAPIPPEVDRIAKLVVDAAYTVHRNLRPGIYGKRLRAHAEARVWARPAVAHEKKTQEVPGPFGRGIDYPRW